MDECTGTGFGWGRRHSYWPRAERSRDRVPVGARFSSPVETGPGVPPSLLYHGYRASFREVEWPGRGVNHTLTCSAEVKENVELYLRSPSGPL